MKKLPANSIILKLQAVVAFFGFVDATYLTVSHFKHEIPPCTLARGCEAVLTSDYATIFGVPVALFGAIGYVSVLLLVMLWFDMHRDWIVWTIVGLSCIAFVASVRFVYVQLFVLHSICQYCMVSAATSTILFLLSMILMRGLRKKEG